jgi:hypothetical protein
VGRTPAGAAWVSTPRFCSDFGMVLQLQPSTTQSARCRAVLRQLCEYMHKSAEELGVHAGGVPHNKSM